MHRLIALTTLLLLVSAAVALAGVYQSKEQALQSAFPNGETVESINLFLTPEQVAGVEKASGARLDSALYTFYAGSHAGKITGYAAIEAATVRTLPQTVLVVLEPDGRVRFTEILAFFEPEEYRPPRRWLDQFSGRELSAELRVGGEIQGITGATLSAHAVSRQVRKSAALCRMLLEGKKE